MPEDCPADNVSTLDARTTPFSLSVLTVTKGNASKHLFVRRESGK